MKRARVNRRRTAIRIRTRQRQRTAGQRQRCRLRPAVLNHTRKRRRPARIRQRRVRRRRTVRHRRARNPRQRPNRIVKAIQIQRRRTVHRQRTRARQRVRRPRLERACAIDRCRSVIAVGPAQRDSAATVDRHRARAADHAVVCHRIRAVKGQSAVVGHVAGDAAGCAAATDLQYARADCRATRIGVRPRQRKRPRTGLRQRRLVGAAVLDHASEGRRGGITSRRQSGVGSAAVRNLRSARSTRQRTNRLIESVQVQIRGVVQRHCAVAREHTRRTRLQRARAVDRRRAAIGVRAAQRQRAGARLRQRSSSAAAVLNHAAKRRRSVITTRG